MIMVMPSMVICHGEEIRAILLKNKNNVAGLILSSLASILR